MWISAMEFPRSYVGTPSIEVMFNFPNRNFTAANSVQLLQE